MANRIFRQFANYLENGPVFLWVQVAIGATGAPTLNTSKSKGIASIARNSAGKYTVTLSDSYVDLFHIDALIELASGSPAAIGGEVLRSYDVKTAKTIVLEWVDSSGTAVEIPSGAILHLNIHLKRSTI